MTREQSAFFESFFRERYQSLVVYAYRYLQNWDDAKEVTQEAFLTGLVKIDQFYSSKSQIGWLKATIQNKARNLTRAQKRRAFVGVPLEAAETRRVTYNHDCGIDSPLARCSELLTPEEFRLFQYVVIDGGSYTDAAAELGINVGACRKRVERIFKKLRKNWDEKNK